MSFLSTCLDGEILFISFSDPATRNAWSLQASRELADVLKSFAGRFRGLVFAAEGRVFCSGGQLSDYAAMSSADEGRKVNDEIATGLAALASLSVPTVCCVGGDSFGGGVELVSAFDVVLATPHVFFGLWQKKIALSFGWGGGARLERRLGPARLRELSLSTRAVSGAEAREIGLVDELVGLGSMTARALEIARQLSSGRAETVSALKGFDSSRERETFQSLWWNEDHKKVLSTRKK